MPSIKCLLRSFRFSVLDSQSCMEKFWQIPSRAHACPAGHARTQEFLGSLVTGMNPGAPLLRSILNPGHAGASRPSSDSGLQRAQLSFVPVKRVPQRPRASKHPTPQAQNLGHIDLR